MTTKASYVAILLPAYNEAAAIPTLLDSLKAFHVVVVDDGSTDKTAEAARQKGLVVVSHKVRRGKGEAIRTGLRIICSTDTIPDAVVVMDADGQHALEDLQELLVCWERTHADLVLGVRNLRSKTMPAVRRWWNIFITFLVSFGTGVRFSDSQSGLRLFSRPFFQEIFLQQKGYCVESEVLFWAAKQHRSIAECVVGIRYYKNKHFRVQEAGRAAAIFSFVMRTIGQNTFGRFLAALKREWRFVSVATLFFLVILLVYQFMGSVDVFDNASRNSENMELEAALAWLKKNSDDDAIVLTQRVLGHQVVAFAGRPVVLTTKVYPTEFQESARRYKDIGQFFFAEDEAQALRIANTYDVSYVFIGKRFSGDFCKGIMRCDLVLDKSKLAPWAYSTTMVGRMIQGAHFAHFQKIWDSSRFVIYKITDVRQGMSAEAKKVAVTIVRRTLESLLYDNKKIDPKTFYPLLDSQGVREVFLQPRGVDITLWDSDRNLRASRIETRGRFLENIIAAAVQSMHDPRLPPFLMEELSGVRIEITVFKNTEAPLDQYFMSFDQMHPAKAYVLEYNGAKTIYVPAIFNNGRFETLDDIINNLCRKAKLEKQCYNSSFVKFSTFDVEDFIESSDRQAIYDLSGPLLVDPKNFNETQLRRRLVAAGEWLLRNQRSDGRYVFVRDALTGITVEGMQLGREAFVEQALVSLYTLTGDRRYLISAERNRRMLREYIAFSKKHFSDDAAITHYFVFSIFADLEFFNATKEKQYLEDARANAELVRAQKNDSGNFPLLRFSSLETEAGATPSSMLNFQALTALAAVANRVNVNQKYREDIEHLADMYRLQFRTERAKEEPQMSLAAHAWLANAFTELYKLTKEEQYLDFVFEVSDWLIYFQKSGDPYIEGSFWNSPHPLYPFLMSPRGSGKVAEGLVDGYGSALMINDVRRMDIYTEALEATFLWLMRMQITPENNFWGSEAHPDLVLGGFRHDLFNHEEWNDSNSHFILAGSRFLLQRE
ncbi:MAG: glycosyl transferase [Parcubacteria group bacterium Gr01-1014_48]|nr:MAG: glycosyl transferase [Parcubacteria group bacterium Greene0416_14]TSC72817.1 MAG: glycosyl transferase [Parcubacteria group bacterium Gr01-1014_48]TSC99694.1 MAG: glycosyl transferase [Parcubacteria group bacterium Greene1014_15]TSD07744.1 MAG: glycosyl transferase [Parcubacteria group bacterium Greene0714_4]